MRELQSFIMQNQSPETLRLVLSYLGDSKKHSSILAREMEIILLGYIASSFPDYQSKM
jgi:hypothetical protein